MIALAALIVPAIATGAIVIGVALAVERLGARRGGLLAGMPIVMGPGFLFLALAEPDAYVAQAATAALASLSATQVFMLAYAGAARAGLAVAGALAAAIGAWTATAAGLAALEPGIAAALALFALATLLARWLGARLLVAGEVAKGREGIGLLVLRGVLAGALVAAVSAGSSRLGPVAAGLLVAYPIGMTVIAAAIHARRGAPTLVATLHAVALGTLSLAAFAATIALAAEPIGALPAFSLAAFVSMLATAALMRMRAPAGAARTR